MFRIICGCLTLALAGFIGYNHFMANKAPEQLILVKDYKAQGSVDLGGPFTLTDHKGKKRTDKDFHGKFTMIYFGYRYCPDICPTALTTMTEALEMMGAKAKHVQPIFITVDPKRDTVEELNEYVDNFHPSLVALTGSQAQIEKAKKAFRVFAVKSDEVRSETDYLIDHSSIIYVLDRQGKFVAHFNHVTPPEDIVAAMRKVL
jgi:protein SCO1/2